MRNDTNLASGERVSTDPGDWVCAVPDQRRMNTFINDLLALQQVLKRGDGATAGEVTERRRLEKKIPAPLLAHFFRQLACDRRGVALVRNGVCSECHIRLPSVSFDNLKRSDDVQLCESCGCYLALPADEEVKPAASVLAPMPVAQRRGRRKLAVA